MKKLYKKLKSVNKQIAEVQTEIDNIKNAPDTFYRSGEKKYQIEKLNHWIGELQESKVKILSAIADAANEEIQKLQGHASVA